MIIRSDFLTEGLFAQVFVWMLEILPHIDSKGWKPEWLIRTKNYGLPPDFNIFPGILRSLRESDGGAEVISFEQLQSRRKFDFRRDFRSAGQFWNSHFAFTGDVVERLDRFWKANFAGQTVLGIHYRGTDKNVDPFQTNPVTQYQFLCVVEDFLKTHPDITSIFVASDDARFVESMKAFPNVRFHEQPRSKNDNPLWNKHDAKDNQTMAKDAILDCLSLSRCRYALKCMSQLSAFAKVLNPELDIYRISACKPSWFPEAYIPVYRSENPAVQSLLDVLQAGDFQESYYKRMMGIHRRMGRIVKQVWKKRRAVSATSRNSR